MFTNKILLLKKDSKLPNGLDFKKGTEFHIVMDVLYMQGFPVPQSLQTTIIAWINNNPNLFKEIFR